MKKKKILLLSDDLRMHSGIATVSKDIVMETLNEYDWVQLAGAIKHPENGKRVDMNQVLREETGVEDAKLTIYPSDGLLYNNSVPVGGKFVDPNTIESVAATTTELLAPSNARAVGCVTVTAGAVLYPAPP